MYLYAFVPVHVFDILLQFLLVSFRPIHHF